MKTRQNPTMCLLILATLASGPARANEDRCEGVTRTAFETEQVAARAAYDQIVQVWTDMSSLEAGAPEASGLRAWQVRGLRSQAAALSRQAHALHDRYQVSSTGEAGRDWRYYLQVRRYLLGWESRFSGSLQRLQIPETQPLRTRVQQAFQDVRRASFGLMTHVSCLPQDEPVIAAHEESDVLEESPVEITGIADDESGTVLRAE